MWRNQGSLPEGQATCHPCRRANAGPVASKPVQTWNCIVCGVLVTSGRRGGQLAHNTGRWCAEHKGHVRCGTCNEWTKSSNASRQGNSYCSDVCRSLRGKPNATDLDWSQCPCGTWLAKAGQEYCSAECRSVRRCPDCGEVQLRKNQQRCKDCRRVRETKRKKRARGKWGSKYRERARYYGVHYEPLDRKKVFIRDNWTCGICGEPVDGELKYPDLMSASLDHIVPMAAGGPHTYANVQCAHFLCNSIKSDKVYAA